MNLCKDFARKIPHPATSGWRNPAKHWNLATGPQGLLGTTSKPNCWLIDESARFRGWNQFLLFLTMTTGSTRRRFWSCPLTSFSELFSEHSLKFYSVYHLLPSAEREKVKFCSCIHWYRNGGRKPDIHNTNSKIRLTRVWGWCMSIMSAALCRERWLTVTVSPPQACREVRCLIPVAGLVSGQSEIRILKHVKKEKRNKFYICWHFYL